MNFIFNLIADLILAFKKKPEPRYFPREHVNFYPRELIIPSRKIILHSRQDFLQKLKTQYGYPLLDQKDIDKLKTKPGFKKRCVTCFNQECSCKWNRHEKEMEYIKKPTQITGH